MKFHNNILHLPVAAAVAAMLTLSLTASSSTPPQQPAADFSRVANPKVPSSLTLCGKKIDLDRADMFERYDRELTSLIYTHGNTLLAIKRANRYFPRLAPILKQNGVPSDLLYLAVTESQLNPRAVSSAKAAGLWQFMPSTAREYGLEVGDEVDERYNIEKATAAACRFFKKALARYGGSWTSVMASYNAGMARISNSLNDQLASDALDLWLVEETQRYPFRVMAYKTIMENPGAYGFTLTTDQLYWPREVTEVTVDGPVASWPEWARSHGISYYTLREENPWIRSSKLTNKAGKSYTVRVPKPESLSRSKAAKPVFNTKWVGK